MRTLAVAHSCILVLALLTPFTLSPSVDVFFAFRMLQTVLMGQYVLLHPRANPKLQALLKGTPMQSIFFCMSWDDLSVALQCFKHLRQCIFAFATLLIFNLSFMWVPLLPLFWTVNTLAIGNFCKCNKTNSCWPKLPYGFGADLTISGCGLFFRSTPINPTFGLWNKP